MGKYEANRYVRRLIKAKDYIQNHRLEVIILGKESPPDDPLMVEHTDEYLQHKQENAAIKILLAEKLKDMNNEE